MPSPNLALAGAPAPLTAPLAEKDVLKVQDWAGQNPGGGAWGGFWVLAGAADTVL